MGPNLLIRLTVLSCSWGTGPSHTIKRHSTHQYFFCSGRWDILFKLKSNLHKTHLHYKIQYKN